MIQTVDECRDLGVCVDRKLNFNSHIKNVIKSAFYKSYQIRKTFASQDAHFLARLFSVYVRPLLEYASVLWSPHHSGRITQIERVQRKFTKSILRNSNLSYSQRLSLLKLPTLADRRAIIDLCILHSVIYGKITIPAIESSIIRQASFRTRGNSMRLRMLIRAKSDTVKYSWLHRTIRFWNQLPEEVVIVRSRFAFKQRLQNIDFSNFWGRFTA